MQALYMRKDEIYVKFAYNHSKYPLLALKITRSCSMKLSCKNLYLYHAQRSKSAQTKPIFA